MCVVQLNIHVNESMAISSVDTGTKTAILIIQVDIYYSVIILSGSQQQLHLEGKHTCMPALPTHWLLLVYLLFDSCKTNHILRILASDFINEHHLL